METLRKALAFWGLAITDSNDAALCNAPWREQRTALDKAGRAFNHIGTIVRTGGSLSFGADQHHVVTWRVDDWKVMVMIVLPPATTSGRTSERDTWAARAIFRVIAAL